MRNHKFRVWDKKKRKMRQVMSLSWIYNDADETLWTHELFSIFYWSHQRKMMIELRKDEFELMQYTGLKDKKGVEICEGDIIYLEYYPGLPTTKDKKDLTDYIQVSWCNGSYYGVGKYCLCYSVGFGGSAVKEWKIIGNIYENPNLLNIKEGV